MISVTGFRKEFRTSAFKPAAIAARDVNFSVNEGEVHGFLGPNGAGKSTTIKALLGLITPSAGELKLFGEPLSSGRWRYRVGYMPEHPNFYEYLTGLEMVTWFAKLTGMSSKEAKDAALIQLERVGLSHALDRRIRTYSKGMMQRAGLAQALLGSPELLILDEPMTGLDPIGRKEIRELILSLRSEGKTIFYSTHILPDIEMTCDRVTIVHKGVTLRSGRLDDILTETTRGITIGLTDISPEKCEILQKSQPGVVVTENQVSLELDSLHAAQKLVEELVKDGGKITRFEPHRDDLETIFMRSLDTHQEETNP
ncbi:MAG: ABC transporter ATP-binding protein [Myxococcales bacterium]|nr:ABC transporter ATP-binding protein [Myxococcales bacterium]